MTLVEKLLFSASSSFIHWKNNSFSSVPSSTRGQCHARVQGVEVITDGIRDRRARGTRERRGRGEEKGRLLEHGDDVLLHAPLLVRITKRVRVLFFETGETRGVFFISRFRFSPLVFFSFVFTFYFRRGNSRQL